MKKVKILIVATTLLSLLFFSFNVNAETGNNNCETDTGVITCDSRLDSSGDVREGIEGTGLWSLLLLALNILAGGVGVAALIGVVYGGILYSSAGGKPEQVKKAYSVFMSVVYGILAFVAMWSLLNYLIPGGVFS